MSQIEVKSLPKLYKWLRQFDNDPRFCVDKYGECDEDSCNCHDPKRADLEAHGGKLDWQEDNDEFPLLSPDENKDEENEGDIKRNCERG